VRPTTNGASSASPRSVVLRWRCCWAWCALAAAAGAERPEAQPLPAPMARLLLDGGHTTAGAAARNGAPAEVAKAPKPEPEREKPAPVKPVKAKEAPVPVARNPVPGKPPGEVARTTHAARPAAWACWR
jgi:hypothetical protein